MNVINRCVVCEDGGWYSVYSVVPSSAVVVIRCRLKWQWCSGSAWAGQTLCQAVCKFTESRQVCGGISLIRSVTWYLVLLLTFFVDISSQLIRDLVALCGPSFWQVIWLSKLVSIVCVSSVAFVMLSDQRWLQYAASGSAGSCLSIRAIWGQCSGCSCLCNLSRKPENIRDYTAIREFREQVWKVLWIRKAPACLLTLLYAYGKPACA